MQSWAIMLMAADGSNPRQLTASEGETICSFGPVWSPDGLKIAFTVEPNPRPTCEMKHTEIAVINTDGSGFKILTQNEANDLAGSWSPDGSQLVFSSNRDGNNQIYIMDADGSNPQRLTELGSTNSMPALSPDGQSIAFVSDRDGNDEIYLMGADGSNPRRLTNNPASDGQPSWSPDGTGSARIVFSSGSPSGGFDIFVMDADGTGLRQLTDDPGWEFEPAWQPLPTSTLSPAPLPGQQVTFQTEDGVQIAGTLYGAGEIAIILAHQGTPVQIKPPGSNSQQHSPKTDLRPGF
jgi:Tol biopolymer transport system component